LSINWAAWLGAGAAVQGDRLEQLAGRGIGSFSQEDGFGLLGQIAASGAAQVAVMPFDLAAWQARNPSAAASQRFVELDGNARAATSERSLRDVLEAASDEPVLARLQEFLSEQLAMTLNMSRARIPADASFQTLGLDSLTGLEFRNRLEKVSGLRLPATLVWNYPTIERLAGYFATNLAPATSTASSSEPAPGPAGADGEPSLEALLANIESLSDEEARQLLAAYGAESSIR
jgi:acyl carrier protein